eukprot:gene9664-1871_t
MKKVLLQWFSGKGYTIFKQPLTVFDDQKKRLNASLFICLDTSYSMGNDLRNATNSVKMLLDEVFDDFDEVILFNYSDYTLVTKLDKNYSGTLDLIKLRGMTNFIDCMKQVKEKTNQTENEVFVLFLTDGHHNSGGDVEEVISQTKCLLFTKSKNISFHSIGFRSGHDAKLLNSISNMGTNEGTFQYAKDSILLKESISNIQNFVHSGTQRMKLKLTIENTTTKFFDFKSGICVIDMEFEKIQNSLSLIADDVDINELDFQNLEGDNFQQLDIFISIQNQKLIEFTNQVSDSEAIDTKELENIDNTLTSMLEDKRFKSLTKLEKSEIFDRLNQTKKMISSIYNAYKKNLKNGLSNDDLATLISSSYDHITKRSIKKRLDKRVMSQMDSLKESEKRLEEIHSKMDFNKIEQQISKESNDFYKCAVSCSNLIESMKEKSSVCLSVKIARNESAIMDPSQLKINEIGNTIISTSAFLDSVQFKLDSLNFNHENTETVHGGFSGKNGSIVKGIAREDISGIIPLYINKDHWKIQKENIIPVFGWMTTLDIFGFESAQLRTIPFVTLSTFLRMSKLSDFHSISFMQVVRTCRQLYIENKMRVLDFEILENRLSDVISNLNLLLGKLLVDDKHYENLNDLILSIIEEFFRRKMKTVGDSFHELLLENMKCKSMVSMRTDLEPHELHEEKIQFVENSYDFKVANDITKVFEDEIKYLFPLLSKFYLVYKKYHKSFLNDFLDEIDKNSGLPSLEMIKELKEILNIEPVESMKKLCELMSIEPLTKEQMYAVIIQSLDSRTNSSRKELIKEDLILNPFKESEVIMKKFLENQKQTQINRIKSHCLTAYNIENKFKKFDLNHLVSLNKISNDFYKKTLESPAFVAKLFKIHTSYTSSIYNRSSILDVPTENCLKELVVMVKGKPIIIVSNGIQTINLISISKALKVDSYKVKFPNCIDAGCCIDKFGFCLDSIPIFGFDKDTPVYLNSRILSKKSDEILICASGDVNFLMKIEVGDLKKIPNLKFLDFETDYR